VLKWAEPTVRKKPLVAGRRQLHPTEACSTGGDIVGDGCIDPIEAWSGNGRRSIIVVIGSIIVVLRPTD